MPGRRGVRRGRGKVRDPGVQAGGRAPRASTNQPLNKRPGVARILKRVATRQPVTKRPRSRPRRA